jgi:hypothetical protein
LGQEVKIIIVIGGVMFKRGFVLMMGILFISATPAGAMMGGHGSGSHGSGGSMMMGGHDGSMDGAMQPQMNDRGGHGNHSMNYDDNRREGEHSMTPSGGMGMDSQTAETMVRGYMQNQSKGSWRMGSQTDGGSYYMTDIMGPNGEVINQVLVDKKTGSIHSLEHSGMHQ